MLALEFNNGAVSLLAFASGPTVLAFADSLALGIEHAFAVLARTLGALVSRLALLANETSRTFACVVLLILSVQDMTNALVLAWLVQTTILVLANFAIVTFRAGACGDVGFANGAVA